MRYLYLCIIALAMSLPDLHAQNLVTNPSFESYSSCPFTISGLSLSTGWRNYHGSTPDYFASCNTALYPTSFAGTQLAASGNAYAGAYTFSAPSWREYIAGVMTPMTPGIAYEVSMSVSLADFSIMAANGLGVWFYDQGPSATLTTIGSGPLSVTPQVLYPDTVRDKTNWVRLKKTFIADSAYDNIVIGCFIPYGSLDTVRTLPTGTGICYYFFDSIVVKAFSHILLDYKDTLLCVGDTMKVPFTVESGFFTSGNVFSLQLSDPFGSFANPVTISTSTGASGGTFKYVIPSTITPGNSYRIRIKSTSVADSTINSRSLSIGNAIPGKPVAGNNGPLCSGNTLVLSAASTTSGVNYSWTGPNAFTSTLRDPAIPSAGTAATGQYIVTARLYGCVSRDTTMAAVIGATGSVSAGYNDPVCSGDTLKLSGHLIAGTATSYSWTGPNGFKSVAKDTMIAAAAGLRNGDYILSAMLSIGCLTKDTVTVVVRDRVYDHSATSNGPVCTGDSLLLFANTTVPGTMFNWAGPSSFSSGSPAPKRYNVANGDAGSYVVSFTSGNGCYVYDTVNVVVKQSPNNISASYNIPLCQSDTLKLNATNSSSGVTWSWTGPLSFAVTTQNTYIANAQLPIAGRYYVKATAANGCYRTDSVDVVIKPQPQNFSIGTNSPICQGGTLSLSGNTSSTGTTFSWSGPGSYSATTQTLSFTNAQPARSGEYRLAATLNGCVIRDTEVVNVVAIPATPIPTANTPVCVGQTLSLDAGSTGPGYAWTGPAGFSSSTRTPSIISAGTLTAGIYTIRAIDGACTSPNATINITVLPAPVANVYPSPKDSICQGASLTFIASASNAGTGYSFKWYRSNALIAGVSASSYNTTTASDYDTYFCTVTTNGTCSTPMTDTSNVITMRVFPWLPASVSISATPNGPVAGGDLINFTTAPVNGGNKPTYQWTRNGKNESGATGSTWSARTLNDKDVVCVNMNSSYQCPQPKTATSNCITVSVNTTGIDQNKLLTGVKIYPNPVTNELTIEGIAINTRIQLFDVLGRMVYNAAATKEKETIDTSALARGAYVLQIVNNNGERMNAKVVKD